MWLQRVFPSIRATTAARTRLFSVSALRQNASPIVVPPGLPEREETIYKKLISRFSPSQLQVEDVSGGCGSFYAILIASESFKGLTMVKQHRLVTDTLKQEIEGIHGLQLKTIAK